MTKEQDYQRRHYEANKELYIARAKVSRATARAKGKAHIKEYLETHPCVDCGNSDIRVLQFDHRDGIEKIASPGQLRASFGKLVAEIAKCDVRCANCHMIRTATQFGWERHVL